jgi:hypothetical protein
MGYHKRKIPKGQFGEFSKIEEEFLEAKDALEQKNFIMLGLELSDLIGAIEEFAKKWNYSIEDLLKMKETTKKVFNEGYRKSK